MKKQRSCFYIALISYLGLSTILFPYFRYQINPDSIEYIALAQKYLAGNFYVAINGLWSPLFSWLMVPLLYLKIDPLLAGRIIILISGLGIITTVDAIAQKLIDSRLIQNTIPFLVVPVLLSFSFTFLTPDLIMVFLLLLYLHSLLDPKYKSSTKSAIICGLLGGLAYLSKSYALIFFVGHFSIINGLYYLNNSDQTVKKKIISNYACGILALFVVAGPWIATISCKYDKLMFTSASKFNYALMAPNFTGRHQLNLGFFAPPTATAIDIMEDPRAFKIESWTPLDSLDDLKFHITRNMTDNRNKAHRFIMSCSILSYVACIGCFVLLTIPLIKKHKYNDATFMLLGIFLTIIIFPIGYILVRVFERYIWIMPFLLILLTGATLDHILQHRYFNKTLKGICIAVFTASFIYYPAIRLKNYDIKKCNDAFEMATLLSTTISPGSNIASDGVYVPMLFTAYHLGARYYGIPPKGFNATELKTDLDTFAIEYYLVTEIEPIGDFSLYKSLHIHHNQLQNVYKMK